MLNISQEGPAVYVDLFGCELDSVARVPKVMADSILKTVSSPLLLHGNI